MSTHKINLLILALLVAIHSGYANAEPPATSSPAAPSTPPTTPSPTTPSTAPTSPAPPSTTTATSSPSTTTTSPAPATPSPKSKSKDTKKDTSTTEQDNYVKKTIVSSCEIKPVMADEDYRACKITPPSYLNHFR